MVTLAAISPIWVPTLFAAIGFMIACSVALVVLALPFAAGHHGFKTVGKKLRARRLNLLLEEATTPDGDEAQS